MSSSDACDAALLAWANACLQSHAEEPAPTLEAVVDTNSVSVMCKAFGLGDPDQGARNQPAAQRRRRVAQMLNSWRVGLVELSVAELGGPAAARSLTAAILVTAVEATGKEQAIQFIVGLDQQQQADLAKTIQQLMDTTGKSDKTEIQADETPLELVRRLSNARRFSTVQLAGNDPNIIEPMQAEARELHRELERYLGSFSDTKQAHQRLAEKVSEAKAQLCHEADRCVDLIQELDEKETEHRSLSRDIVSLREEMKHETTAALSNSEAFKELADRIEEERRRYRTFQMHHIDFKAELDQALHSSSKVETSSWKRTAMLAKLSRLQEKVHCDRAKLANVRRSYEVEEACADNLREELEQAQELLATRDHGLSACEESCTSSEGILQQAESELDSCRQELKAMTSEDLDSIRLEIEKRKQALARAEQGTADTVALRANIGAQMPEVSAMLEDRRLAAERATDEAVAEGVAVTKAVQRLHQLSDEAISAAQGVADIATRQPRASLTLAGPAATSLAVDAEQLQKLSDELGSSKVEAASMASQALKLGKNLEDASEKAAYWRRRHEEAESAEASSPLQPEEAQERASSEPSDRPRILRVEAEIRSEEELAEALREQMESARFQSEALQEALASAASAAAAFAAEEAQFAARSREEAAEALEAEAEYAEEAEAEAPIEADFSAMVKRDRAPARAAKDAAAARLQARQRGIMARSKMASLRASRTSGAIPDVSYQRPKQLAPAPREERERAAIKLQALERGILARAKVQQLRASRARASNQVAAAPRPVKVSKRLQSISEAARLSLRASFSAASSGPSVELLEEQLHLREQELSHREALASEAEAAHSREVSLMSSALHRLGMRYGRLLGQCQALEALVPERVRRLREERKP